MTSKKWLSFPVHKVCSLVAIPGDLYFIMGRYLHLYIDIQVSDLFGGAYRPK